MDLSIIIVNYNSREKTFFCLDSIYNSVLAGINFEIIVVDNFSTEKIGKELEKKYPEVIFIQSDKNLGMGGGNNLGIKKSKGKNILILNADTELRKDSIKSMLSYLEADDSIGLLGPKLLYPDGSYQQSCYRYPKIFIPILRRTFLGLFAKDYINDYLMNNIDINQPRAVDWIRGCALLIRKKVLDEVGIFDERFFLYLEDTDLCKRINTAGLKVVYFPGAQIVHHHGRMSAEQAWFIAIFKNKISRIHIASWIKYYLKWKFK